MNQFLIFLLLSFFTQVSCAQRTVKDIVKTTDGKSIKLFTDHTWEYVSLSKTSSATYSKYKSPNTATNSSIKKVITNKSKAGKTYYRGPRGGCYYLTASGNKVYVDRDLCK